MGLTARRESLDRLAIVRFAPRSARSVPRSSSTRWRHPRPHDHHRLGRILTASRSGTSSVRLSARTMRCAGQRARTAVVRRLSDETRFDSLGSRQPQDYPASGTSRSSGQAPSPAMSWGALYRDLDAPDSTANLNPRHPSWSARPTGSPCRQSSLEPSPAVAAHGQGMTAVSVEPSSIQRALPDPRWSSHGCP